MFELLVRERLLQKGTLPAHQLHRRTVGKVNAVAQASAYHTLLDALSEEETAILKRGRNSSTSRVPKSCTPEDYRKATAVEALFGYLYLKDEMERIDTLYQIIESFCEDQASRQVIKQE